MAEAYIIDAVRTPVGKRGGGLSHVHPADLGAFPIQAAHGAHRRRPRRGRGRGLRLPRRHRPPGRRHRPHLLAGRRPARGGARHHHRPPVRLVAAGRALRRAGRHERHRGPDRGRRRAEHERHPHLVGHDRGRAVRLRRSVQRVEGLAGPLRRPGDQPVPRRRPHRREVGHQPRGHGGLRPREPPPGRAGHRRGPLRARDRAVRGRHRRRGLPPRHLAREDGHASRPCARAGGSPPRWRARSATPARPCWWPASRR